MPEVSTPGLDANAQALVPTAVALSKVAPEANPVVTPAALQFVPKEARPAVDAIRRHPVLSAIACGAVTVPTFPPSGGSASTRSQSEMVDAGQHSFFRVPGVRHTLLGFKPLTLTHGGTAGATDTLSADPQDPFKGNRLCIPLNTIAIALGSAAPKVSISRMLVGNMPQNGNGTPENTEVFEPQSTGAMWDMDRCDIGQDITCTAKNADTGNDVTVYGAILGEDLDGTQPAPLRSPLKRIAIPTTVVAAGDTVEVKVTPQGPFVTRKVALNADSAAFLITGADVGMKPQFASHDPVPAAVFIDLAGMDMWLEWDEAYVGNDLIFTITNLDAVNPHTFSGSLLGDIDPAALKKMTAD